MLSSAPVFATLPGTHTLRYELANSRTIRSSASPDQGVATGKKGKEKERSEMKLRLATPSCFFPALVPRRLRVREPIGDLLLLLQATAFILPTHALEAVLNVRVFFPLSNILLLD